MLKRFGEIGSGEMSEIGVERCHGWRRKGIRVGLSDTYEGERER